MYYQLIDKGTVPTPVPTVPILPQAGHEDGAGGGAGSVLLRLGLLGAIVAGGWLLGRKMSEARRGREIPSALSAPARLAARSARAGCVLAKTFRIDRITGFTGLGLVTCVGTQLVCSIH